MKLKWDPDALDDRRSILEFISADGPRAALKIDDLIVDAARSLKQFPHRGRDGRSPGTRELVIPNTRYIVAYLVEEDTIVILRVLDGARKWPKLRTHHSQ